MAPIFLLHCLIAMAHGLATRADGGEPVPVARPIDARTTNSRNSGRSIVQDETIWIEVRGKNLPSALMGASGEGLREELSGCGGLTGWKFEQTPDDCCYQWYASGALPFGKKSCVGRAIQSAGGSSNGGCKRDTSSIDDWPSYGDSGRHVFKHLTPSA